MCAQLPTNAFGAYRAGGMPPDSSSPRGQVKVYTSKYPVTLLQHRAEMRSLLR